MNNPMENYTRNIYTLIGDENYQEAIRLLEIQLSNFKDCVAIHSLIAYCAWQMEDYQKAAAEYGRLVELNPNKASYRLHHANALYKIDQYEAAMSASFGVEDPELQPQLLVLQAAIRYAQEDIQSAKSILPNGNPEDINIMLDNACILFKESQFEQALNVYMEIKRIHGFIPEVAYCIALCYYRLNRLSEAVQMIAEIKTQAGRNHPELLRNLVGDAVDFDAQGLISKARDAFYVEGVNLMSAIEYDQNHIKEAKEALKELPNRNEEELDPVTLHNTAIVNMDDDPTSAFTKLSFLLNQDITPPETFRNLLLGYCKFEYYTYAADLLAENTERAQQSMDTGMLDFLDALLLCATSKEEAYRKFDDICKQRAEVLRRIYKAVDDARKTHDDQLQTQLTLEYEASVNDLIPVLMAQAKIFWDMGSYDLVELLLMKYAEFCENNRKWRLNLAHTYFMEPGKVNKAIEYYEPLVLSEQNLLDVEAIIVANLCVSYVMVEENDFADQLINRLTDEENNKKKEDENAKFVHLSIIHLVIGTLYCAHSNFEFGIDYVFKAFNPMQDKLSADTWFYAKKCLFELTRCLALRQFVLADAMFNKIIEFLDNVDKYGKKIEAINDLTIDASEAHENQTVSFEARVLKATILKFYDF
ncbi:TPR Domain containing protein [Trichomonas vaginalis G3]|uniref:TPR Domain containing protein n=1 Tax=Trichomonas vaginalis (strain ATCC PRA-98 / G3) TaxID=412133 RepID=A2D955_TRIV3|nr:tetratricopeptide repeat protein 30a family [Trichomonas vaginalis G3]EAY23081.1 TPR Domain containing protein [Trichomonas vaginalis G3]KAI5519049.1 tetratricopeptide repeat protein 30a family [Trichomonas vaginalis G3]|eukprot:XP_001584067.1 TPR Domain containing protein [Trichomonas vaginalis G3]